jgi:GNAT superfamily N-acetyltransferase
MKIVIRKICRSDYAAAAVIWREVLDVRNATDENVAETYEIMNHDDRYVTFVAEADGKIVGLAAAVKVLAIGHPGGYVKMNGIGVLPEYRHQGIGTMVVDACEEWADELCFSKTVVESRDNKVEFYKWLGYEVCGEAVDGDTFRCIRMEKML